MPLVFFMDFSAALSQISQAINAKKMVIVVGNCYVEYWGRAASKLARGQRLVMIKGDNSFAIHQNRLLRPVNYMMNARIHSEVLGDNSFLLSARKQNPKEEIKVFFYKIDFVYDFLMDAPADLRLFGSERELSDQLMNDLSFIEPGLVAIKKEDVFRKGIVDIIAEDAAGNLVVIEVKRRKADFAAVTQLQRYMQQVQKMKGKKTRGLLLAPDITKAALELLENNKLEFFKLEFEIGNPSAKIKGAQKKQPTITEFL